MPITQNDDFYAALSDSAANKFLRNLCAARPHLFNYATKGLGGGTPAVGLLEPLQLPGVDAIVDYAVQIAQPILAFYPTGASPPKPAPPIKKNQFRLSEKVTWSVSQQNAASLAGSFEVWCVGSPVVVTSAGGSRVTLQAPAGGFVVNGTGNLDPIFTYFGQLVIGALLSKVSLPLTLINQGALTVKLATSPANPIIDSSQLQVWANLS